MQKEERLKHYNTESAHLASTSKAKGKNSEAAKGPDPKKLDHKKDLCFFLQETWTSEKELYQVSRMGCEERYITCFGLF